MPHLTGWLAWLDCVWPGTSAIR